MARRKGRMTCRARKTINSMISAPTAHQTPIGIRLRHRRGFPVEFGNGYPAQQELFRRRRRQEMSQVMADLVEQQLEVVRRKLPPEEADRVVSEAIQYLPMEAAEAVTRALAKAARK